MKYYLLAILMILPSITSAQAEEMETFTGSIPFLDGIVNTANFAEALFNIAIAIAAILVVVRLIWAGSKYMLSGLVTSKESAKQDIRDALIGLLIILGSVTILQTINPQLLNLNALGTLKKEVLISPELEGAYVTDDTKFSVGDKMPFTDAQDFCNSKATRDELCLRRIEAALAKKCEEAGGVKMEKRLGEAVGGWGSQIRFFYYHCD